MKQAKVTMSQLSSGVEAMALGLGKLARHIGELEAAYESCLEMLDAAHARIAELEAQLVKALAAHD